MKKPIEIGSRRIWCSICTILSRSIYGASLRLWRLSLRRRRRLLLQLLSQLLGLLLLQLLLLPHGRRAVESVDAD
jgi:hypothetical protein